MLVMSGSREMAAGRRRLKPGMDQGADALISTFHK
jgi:hypothetical protein